MVRGGGGGKPPFQTDTAVTSKKPLKGKSGKRCKSDDVIGNLRECAVKEH